MMLTIKCVIRFLPKTSLCSLQNEVPLWRCLSIDFWGFLPYINITWREKVGCEWNNAVPEKRTFSLEKCWFQPLQTDQNVESESNFLSKWLNQRILYERWVADPPPLSVLKITHKSFSKELSGCVLGVFLRKSAGLSSPGDLSRGMPWFIGGRYLSNSLNCSGHVPKPCSGHPEELKLRQAGAFSKIQIKPLSTYGANKKNFIKGREKWFSL